MAEGGAAPTRPRFPPGSRALTFLLTMLVAYGALSNNMYLPSFPSMARGFGVPTSDIALTLSFFFAGFSVGQLFYGSLSDRFGRRPVLLAGLAGYTAASLVCALAPDIHTLFWARAAQGLAAAATQVLARAIVRDLFAPDRAARMLSVMAAVFTLVPAFAPLLGGLFETWFGWRATFVTLTGIGAATMAATWIGLAESLPRRDDAALSPARMALNYRLLLTDRSFMGYTFAFAFIFAGMFAFHSGSPFVLIELLGVGPRGYGLLFMVVVMGYLAGSLISARLTMSLGYHRLVAAGGVAAIAGGALMVTLWFAGIRGWAAIIGPQLVFMLGTGLIMPNAIAGALAAFPDKAGAASALFGFLQQVTGAAMVAVLGFAADGTALPMVCGILSGAVLSLGAYGVAASARRRPRP